jgi:hypothetical protein|tara:strand:- start:10 stop:336 length:327 start_codon:yes stop_codon:yes gene_type:complete
MAVTKTLTGAVPYNLNSKVQQWDFTMKYEEGADATYYTSTMHTSIPATDPINGVVNFTPKAEGEWTLAELTALCPISQWDDIFDSQYDSVITNPPDNPVPDPDYVIPS